MSVVLADLGGTHLRLARATSPRDVAKYKIADHGGIEELLHAFEPDISALFLASAIHPRDGVIEDKRFGDRSHWYINLEDLKRRLRLERLVVLNDLEAAAYALPVLEGDDLCALLPAQYSQSPFENPPRLLIGIGTGIGHAFVFEREHAAPFVQRSHGGPIPVLALSEEQRGLVKVLEQNNTRGRDVIVEDIVSGYGISALKAITDEETALRVFWESLGLYCNNIVSVAGAYGGIYLTGGVMDELFAAGKVDMDSFKNYFLRPMVPIVTESLAATPVYYCRQPNMPLIGLSSLAGV